METLFVIAGVAFALAVGAIFTAHAIDIEAKEELWDTLWAETLRWLILGGMAVSAVCAISGFFVWLVV